MELENRGRGINLSVQTLDGILSHNGEKLQQKLVFNPKKTKADFLKEYRRALAFPSSSLNITPMTLEAAVVRVADVIAYIGRDIEDARKVGLIRGISDVPKGIRHILGRSCDKINDRIIDALVKDVIVSSYGKNYIALSKEMYKVLGELKKFNYKYIYFNPVIKRESAKIKHMFRFLFDKYLYDFKRGEFESRQFESFICGMSRKYLESNPKERVVVDFIAGMTDKFFINEYKMMSLPCNFGLKLKSKDDER
jgi:dGTPase